VPCGDREPLPAEDEENEEKKDKKKVKKYLVKLGCILALTRSMRGHIVHRSRSIARRTTRDAIKGDPRRWYSPLMQRAEALAVLGLDPAAGAPSAAALRRAFLRAAVRLHPDKNPGDASANDRFASLTAAHDALLTALADGAAAAAERARASALLDLLRRALLGEDVRAELSRLGVHRPAEGFGVDLAVPFARWAPPAGAPPPDARAALAAAFAEAGLDAEGAPLGGWARPPVVDEENL
jgi:hypothetical protein